MMHPMVTALLRLPGPMVLLIVIVLSVAVGLALHETLLRWRGGAMHKRARPSASVAHEEFMGHFFGVIGVLYAVVLAFVVVTAWQQRDHVEEVVMQEQDDVRDLLLLVDQYEPFTKHPTGRSSRLPLLDAHKALVAYAAGMAKEWEQMRYGSACSDYTAGAEARGCFDEQVATAGSTLSGLTSSSTSNLTSPSASNLVARPGSSQNNLAVHRIASAIFSLQPANGAQTNIHREAIHDIELLLENRDHRRRHAEEHLQFTLWLALFIGGLVTLSVGYFRQFDERAQLVRTLSLSAMIGMMFAIGLIYDHPFNGPDGIESTQWEEIANAVRYKNFEGKPVIAGASKIAREQPVVGGAQ